MIENVFKDTFCNMEHIFITIAIQLGKISENLYIILRNQLLLSIHESNIVLGEYAYSFQCN